MSQMPNEQSQCDPNDPRLTAYVLDELSTEERVAIERLLAASPEARAVVAEIRETVAELQSAFDAEPIMPLEELMSSDPSHHGSSAVIRSASLSNSDSQRGLRTATGPHQPVSRRAKLLLTGTVAAALILAIAIVRGPGSRPADSTDQLVTFTEGYATSANLSDLARQMGDIVAQRGNREEGELQLLVHPRVSISDSASEPNLVLGVPVNSNAGGNSGASSAPVAGQGQLGRNATVVLSDGATRPALEPGIASNSNGTMAGVHIASTQAPTAGGSLEESVTAAPTPLHLAPSSASIQTQPNVYSDPLVRQEISGIHGPSSIRSRVNGGTAERYGKQPALDATPGMTFANGSGSQDLYFLYQSNGIVNGAPVVPNGSRGPRNTGNGIELPAIVADGADRSLGIQPGTVQTENGYVLHDHLQFLPAQQSGQANSAGQSPADLAKWKAEFAQRATKGESLVDRKNIAYWGTLDVTNTDGVLVEKEQLAQERRSEIQPRWYFNSRPDLQQQNTEAYEPIVEHEFLSPRVAPLSTFGVDVDTASYSNVRRFLTQGQLPPPNAVRIEELLNYFKYSDPAPQGGKPFSVNLEAAACPWNPAHKLVRIGLKGKEIPRNERPASNLVYLIDVSGSMKEDNKLPLVKSGLELLVNEMTDNDRVAIVTYAGHAGVALESTPGSERQKILNVIRSLNADGSTNGEAGLQLAYEQAAKHLIANGTNRVILCTDGDFNVGVSDDDQLVQIIGRQAKSGVYLSIFGFGMGNLKDAKLEKLADKGNGHYGYVDGIREAQKVFVEEMTGTLYTIAKDVKVQIEFNPAKVGAYRLIGYENRIMPAQDFHNDAKDAGDIGAGHSVTALYEIVPPGQPLPQKGLKYQAVADVKAPEPQNNSPELLTLSLRYKRPEAITAPGVADGVFQRSVQEDYPLAEPTDGSAKTSENFRWSAAVAAFGMVLRDSPNRGLANLRMVHELASGSTAGWGDPRDRNYQTAEHVRRNEFLELVKLTSKLRGEISLEESHRDGVERKANEEFDIRKTSDVALAHTAVKKEMSEQDARQVLAGEGFQLDPDQSGVKQGWLRFRKPWSVGGHHDVTLRIEKEQVVEFDENWNDP